MVTAVAVAARNHFAKASPGLGSEPAAAVEAEDKLVVAVAADIVDSLGADIPASAVDIQAVGSLEDSPGAVGNPAVVGNPEVLVGTLEVAADNPAAPDVDQEVEESAAAVEAEAEVALVLAQVSSQLVPQHSRLSDAIRLEFSSLLDYRLLRTSTKRRTSTVRLWAERFGSSAF